MEIVYLILYLCRQIQNGVLREFIEKEICSFRGHMIDDYNAHNAVTLAVLYLAVMEKGGDIKNGGTSYVQGKWSIFFSQLLE